MDVERLHALPPLSDFPISRILGGLFRLGVQGVARRLLGHAARRHTEFLSKLGLSNSPPDIQRFPLRARWLARTSSHPHTMTTQRRAGAPRYSPTYARVSPAGPA